MPPNELAGRKGVVGLQNMGLTCYANAVLQCLRHIERIPWIFTKGRYNTLFQKSSTGRRALQEAVADSFSDMMTQQENGTFPGILRPAGFWGATHRAIEETLYEQFRTRAPHDAHEFLMFMLETLHESISMEVEMQIVKKQPRTEEEKRVISALETWKTSFQKEYSPLVDIFYGLLHVKMECQRCKNVTHRWETFNTLKASTPKHAAIPVDIRDLLRTEFEGEEIEGYHCETCAPTRTTARRTHSLWRLPQTIIVCLKRFNYDGRKIHTPVDVPERFDMAPFFSAESTEKDGGATLYNLRSVVDHHGGAGGGHYTAQCRDKQTNQWILYDDETPYQIPHPRFGDSTYILFYERVTKDYSQKAPQSHL